MKTPIVWKNDILTAEDILLRKETPKYIQVNHVNEQVNGLKGGDVLKIISVFSEPCIRCKFFFKDGSIQHIFGQKEVNIPICYPDYLLTLQSDHYFSSVASLAKHCPRKVRPSLDNNCLFNKLPFFQRKEFWAKGIENEMLALKSNGRTVFLPSEIDMEFIELNDSESINLVDFMNHHLCPQYVRFLNWNLAQDVFQIDIRDVKAEIEFVFDQHLLICEKLGTLGIDNESDVACENVQWAFPTMYINESPYKSSFYISEEYADLQTSNHFENADIKTAVAMVNTIKNCEQPEACRFILQERINPTLEQVPRIRYTSRDDLFLTLSNSSSNYDDLPNFHTILDDCLICFRGPPDTSKLLAKSIKWSTKTYSLSYIIRSMKNNLPLPKFLKLDCHNASGGHSDHEFLLKSNDICKIIDIQKHECIKATLINSNKSITINIPLSYPFLISDSTGNVGDSKHSACGNSGTNNDHEALFSLASLVEVFDRKSVKEIQILEKKYDKNNIFRYLYHFSHEIELKGKKFDQYYVILKVFKGMEMITVIVPFTSLESKFQFFISDKYTFQMDASQLQTLKANEAMKTEASNFPIAVDFKDDKDKLKFLGRISKRPLSKYKSSDVSRSEFLIAQTLEVSTVDIVNPSIDNSVVLPMEPVLSKKLTRKGCRRADSRCTFQRKSSLL